MWGILGVFLQAAAGQILYLALHLESGSFPRPLSPAAERAAFAALRTGGVAGRDARDQLVRHNLRLVAHVCKKYYAATSNQDDLISIGTIGLIKAVDTFDPARASKFASYASRCIENELRMELRKIRREGAAVSLQEPLESGSGQLTLADTLPDDTVMEDDCERRADAAPHKKHGPPGGGPAPDRGCFPGGGTGRDALRGRSGLWHGLEQTQIVYNK